MHLLMQRMRLYHVFTTNINFNTLIFLAYESIKNQIYPFSIDTCSYSIFVLL